MRIYVIKENPQKCNNENATLNNNNNNSRKKKYWKYRKFISREFLFFTHIHCLVSDYNIDEIEKSCEY